MNTGSTTLQRLGTVSAALIASTLLGSSAMAEVGPTKLIKAEPTPAKTELTKITRKHGTYVELTGSRIKQKVGRTSVRASTMMPVIVYDSSTINKSGASTIAQFLSRSSVSR